LFCGTKSKSKSRVWRREIGATEMDDAGGILAAVVCALLVFAIFPLLLWRRRSDAATAAGDNHRLPPQPLEVPPTPGLCWFLSLRSTCSAA
jgi:hypothetical protein